MTSADDIVAVLTERFAPVHIEIADESARHAGHPGARSGGGHFRVRLVAEAFRGRALVARHRLVHEALGRRFEHEIHALALETLDPDEWAAQG